MKKNSEIEHTNEKILGNIFTQCMNEIMVDAQMDQNAYYSPVPAKLDIKENGTLDKLIRNLIEELGGVPSLMVRDDGDPHSCYDSYSEAIIHEAIASFNKSHSVICRAHRYYIGLSRLLEGNDIPLKIDDENVKKIIRKEIESLFWENAETSYIRLSSFWDRIGQILAFSFFNIRQFDREVYSSVIDNLSKNYFQKKMKVSKREIWDRISQHKNSQKENGYGWLSRRRNLIVHSIHLDPNSWKIREGSLYTLAFNHLEEKKQKLNIRTPKEELKILHDQLRMASRLFTDIIEISIIGAKLLNTRKDHHILS